MVQIKDFEVGQTIESQLLVTQASRGVTASSSPYLSLVLQDQTGQVEAKLWDAKEEQIALLKVGTIINVKADVNRYRNNIQLKVLSIEVVPEGSIDAAYFLESAPMSKELMMEKLEGYIYNITNQDMQRIIYTLHKRYKQSFYEYPAATRNHHEYVSGLAYHVCCMLDLGKAICDLYPSLDRSLLYSGIILHDLGKLIELSGPVLTEYTVEGRLVGHISIMQAMVKEIADSQNIQGEVVILLQHMILSHHGKLEYGSPVLPMIKEAEMLAFIDNIDARMYMMNRALEGIEPGTFTPRIFSLENRSFYKPKTIK